MVHVFLVGMAPSVLSRAAARADSVLRVAVASQPVMTSSVEVMRAISTVGDLVGAVKQGRAVKRGPTVRAVVAVIDAVPSRAVKIGSRTKERWMSIVGAPARPAARAGSVCVIKTVRVSSVTRADAARAAVKMSD